MNLFARVIVLYVTLPLACILTIGCAGERAAFEVAKQSGMAITTVCNNAAETLDRVRLEGRGKINNPTYRFQGFWVTGLDVTIGLDGVELEGMATGEGSGRVTDPAAVVALQAALRAKLAERYPGDELVSEAIRVGGIVISRAPSTSPAP